MMEPASDSVTSSEPPSASASSAPPVTPPRRADERPSYKQSLPAPSKTVVVPRTLRPRLDRRLLLMSLLAGFPAVLISLVMLWTGPYTAKVVWTLSVMIVGFWLGFSFALKDRVVYPLQTLSNLLAALREGDFSIRARGASIDDALGEAMMEVNYLGQVLREQRLGALEATALLKTVMHEIDVAVFAFDHEQRLRLVNRAGERLLDMPGERAIGRNATDLGLAECLTGDEVRTMPMNFTGAAGRYEVRRSTFRERGVPHQLLVLSDLSRALREEERQAWQRLVRVLGHELNNSLAPIKSIAGSLESLVARERPPDDWKEDMQRGLSVISSRAASLSRFMDAYARLARLPSPKLQPLRIVPLIERVASLITRINVRVISGPEMVIHADGDQLEQLLINLLRNAVDAAVETDGGVQVSWRRTSGYVEVTVADEGPGLSNTSNLFVPFFTTKPGGSGIGLVLSRQIAEAHGGTLTLENRQDQRGCMARLRLPL